MDSIVPYNRENSSVVLRHENSLVLYNPQSREITLRTTTPQSPAETSAPTLRPPSCPYCSQQVSEDLLDEIRRRETAAAAAAAAASHHHRRDSTGNVHNHHPQDESNLNNGFITPEYFRILNARLLGDTASAGDGSPTLAAAARRLSSPPGSPRRWIPGPTVGGIDESLMSGVSSSGPATGASSTSSKGNGSQAHKISSSAYCPGYFDRFFVKERELGKGGKGVVLLVRHVLDGVNLGLFACKRVPVGDDHEWLIKVLYEVQLLQQLSHQNLVSYRHAWLEDMQINDFGPSVPCAFILQQFCNSGDLQGFIYDKRGSRNTDLKEQLKMRRFSRAHGSEQTGLAPKLLPFQQIVSFFRDIASGLNYLHTNGYIHRDLKPSNCLLHDPGIPGSPLRVLVSDFGEVQELDAIRKSTGATGTISYCAPEVLHNDGPDGQYGAFSTKSDIFSLGLILHFMCFGKLPYVNADEVNEENEDLEKLRTEILEWAGYNDKYRTVRNDIPDKLFRNMGRLLSLDPVKRPSAADILSGIRSEFGYGEDGIPMRGPASPKATNLGLGDDGRFHRFSPVPSSPGTPVNNTSTAPTPFQRAPQNKGKSRNHGIHNNNKSKHHTRQSSKLREITSQLHLPDSLISASSSDNNSDARVVQATTDSSSGDDGDTSSDESPFMRPRTQSLILRPKKQSPTPPQTMSNPESPRSSPKMIAANGHVGHSMIPIKTPPALTAPPSPTFTATTKEIAMREFLESGTWLGIKVVLFLLKLFMITHRCSPIGPNPWVFQSLILLALADLFGPFFFTTILLFILHFVFFHLARYFDSLCATTTVGLREGWF